MTPLPVPRPLLDVLIDHGLPRPRAELWAAFVGHAVALLQQAATRLREPAPWVAFVSKRGALGVPRRRRGGQAFQLPIEDAVTSELGHHVALLRQALPRGHFLRLHEVEFHTESLVESEERTGRHSRKADFSIRVMSGLGQPELVIEAKPIIAAADVAGRYLAEEGLGCFVDAPSPYTRAPVAGMLAYALSDKGERSWRGEIHAALASLSPTPLGIEAALIPVLGAALTLSRHVRAAAQLGPIAILHVEMLFKGEVARAPSPPASPEKRGHGR